MATTHISETTLDTAKKFHIYSSPVPLAMYMNFHENRTIFLNSRLKWVKYDLPGLTIKKHKVAMSTANSHIRFVLKGTKTECGQEFLVTNYPDLLIRDTIVDGAPDRDLIWGELPRDELKLSNFITNRDYFIYHEISRNLRREFAPVSHDECKENLRKIKSEHFLDRKMSSFHTYHLGGSNYLTAAGEVTYFYKCRPQLVAAIQAQTFYDAHPVKLAWNNYTLTSFTQEDGEEVIAPRYYIEPLTHRITSVAKRFLVFCNFLRGIRTSLASHSR